MATYNHSLCKLHDSEVYMPHGEYEQLFPMWSWINCICFNSHQYARQGFVWQHMSINQAKTH